jgi:single-stranded DNA-specific DHH superfamily exonuclease
MLTPTQFKEIKAHLERAQNPLFLFDNDQDGLCSFLLLQKFIGRGKGFPAKSFPDLNSTYFRKVIELKADYVFILDKPVVSPSFFEEAEKYNIPVVWIDHHEIPGFNPEALPKFVSYYNPVYNKNSSNEPVTVLSYEITQRKEDLWLAVAGSVFDHYYPDYYIDFQKKFPDLCIDSKEPFEIFYKSEIGKISKMLGFGLKDRTTEVINMLKFLIKAKTPYDVLEENSFNKNIHSRFDDLNKKYQKLVSKALEIGWTLKKEEKILYFQYAGDLSISGDLSNELNFIFPDKVILVAYVKGTKANISIRGKKIRPKLLKAIEGLEGATGGGHEDAVGAQVRIEDIEIFRKNFEKLIE